MSLKENILDVAGGPHVAAIATIDGKLPAVRFMVLNGFPDMTFVGGTIKSSNKVAQLKKNPNVAISTWSGKEFSDPYVVMRAKGEIHDDLATKKKYWNPMFEQYFKSVDNPDFVVLVFTASEFVYHGKNMMTEEVWKRQSTSSSLSIHSDENHFSLLFLCVRKKTFLLFHVGV